MNSKSRHLRSTLLAVSILCLLPSAAIAAEPTFARTLPVTGPVTLHVFTRSGYIHLSPGPDNQIHILGHVRASGNSGNSAEEISKLIAEPPISQTRDTVRVGDERSKTSRNQISIDYEIAAPRNAAVIAESDSGEIRLNGLNRGVNAQPNSSETHGGQRAPSKLETASGPIEAQDLAGSWILQTGIGDIHARFTEPGDVVAGTSSGNVRLENVRGAVEVEVGSGNLQINGQPTSSWNLETGLGSITLALGKSPFTLDATTGSGSITSSLSIAPEGPQRKHHIMGTVNGGGPTVKVLTSSGKINLQS